MASYVVKVEVRPRPLPSPYASSTASNLPVGYTFDSDKTMIVNPSPPVEGQVGPITYVQIPTGYWVPLMYKGIEYVKEVVVTPPPTGGKKFNLNVEGFQPFNGTLTPLA